MKKGNGIIENRGKVLPKQTLTKQQDNEVNEVGYQKAKAMPKIETQKNGKEKVKRQKENP